MTKKVPEGWQEDRFEKLAKVESGFAFKSSDFSDDIDAVRIVRMSNLKDGRLDFSDAAAVAPTVVSGLDRFSLQERDFLFGMSGSLTNYASVRKQDLPCYLNQRVGRLVCQNASRDFVKHLFVSPSFQQEIDGLSAGAAQKNVSAKQIESIFVLFPPLPEQEKIAEILGSVDEVISATRQVIERTRSLKRSLTQTLLTKGIPGRHKKFKDSPLGKIPEGWAVAELGDAGEWFCGGTPARGNPDFWNGNIPWISPKDMKVTHLASTQESLSHLAVEDGARLIPEGAVFVVVRGMILAHSFPVAISKTDAALNQDMRALVPNKSFHNEFVRLWLTIQTHQLLTLIDASSHGTKRMQSELLFGFKIPRPSMEEQVEISESILRIEMRLAKEEDFLKGLLNLKDSLSQDLLSGDIRVPVSNKQQRKGAA